VFTLFVPCFKQVLPLNVLCAKKKYFTLNFIHIDVNDVNFEYTCSGFVFCVCSDQSEFMVTALR